MPNYEARLSVLERRNGNGKPAREVAVIVQDGSGKVREGAEYLPGGAAYKADLVYFTITVIDTRGGAIVLKGRK